MLQREMMTGKMLRTPASRHYMPAAHRKVAGCPTPEVASHIWRTARLTQASGEVRGLLVRMRKRALKTPEDGPGDCVCGLYDVC